MLERFRTILKQCFGWIIPALIAVAAVRAINSASNAKSKEKRLEDERRAATQDFIDDVGDDVTAAHDRLQTAQQKTRAANEKAKARLERLASTSETMAESLDRYRRERGLHDSSDAT